MYNYFSLSSFSIFRRMCCHYMYKGLYYRGRNPVNSDKFKIGNKYYNIADQISKEEANEIRKKFNGNNNKSKSIFGNNSLIKKNGGLKGGATGRKRY